MRGYSAPHRDLAHPFVYFWMALTVSRKHAHNNILHQRRLATRSWSDPYGLCTKFGPCAF